MTELTNDHLAAYVQIQRMKLVHGYQPVALVLDLAGTAPQKKLASSLYVHLSDAVAETAKPNSTVGILMRREEVAAAALVALAEVIARRP